MFPLGRCCQRLKSGDRIFSRAIANASLTITAGKTCNELTTSNQEKNHLVPEGEDPLTSRGWKIIFIIISLLVGPGDRPVAEGVFGLTSCSSFGFRIVRPVILFPGSGLSMFPPDAQVLWAGVGIVRKSSGLNGKNRFPQVNERISSLGCLCSLFTGS